MNAKTTDLLKCYAPQKLAKLVRKEHEETGLSISSIIIARLYKSYKQEEQKQQEIVKS